ncbi:MAG: hypothetical protein B7Z37_02960 [Verrucomicrobia bacterium 12-59-8]|nr:MAG: hypothetical protein B7Z37_02960 [Verrucomicrobia bacterium 12-59-8]
MTHTPTEEQALIIAAVAAGKSIIVNALAGAAKTSTIQMAAPKCPANTLALAFNKGIQMELEGRLPSTFQVKTINALGFAAWKKIAGNPQLDSSKVSKIMRRLDPKAPWDLAKVVSSAKLNGLVVATRKHMGQGILEDTRPNWEALADDLDTTLVRDDPYTRERKDYLDLCRKTLEASIDESFTVSIDFDDQVYMPTCFGAPFPKFDCVMVDEAQDLSPLNHLMLKKLKPPQLIVVGDPLQSIYAFRGADTQSMPKLGADWNLEPFTLSVCFRCATSIVEVARTWAPHMQSPEWMQQGEVKFDITDDEGMWDMDSLPPAVTILCRNNAPLIKLALKIFKTRKIAFLNSRAESAMLSALRTILRYKKDLTLEQVAGKIETSRMNKLDNEDPKKHERIMDEHDALQFCVDSALAEGRDYAGLERLISELFQNKNANVWFGTGHGAKGKEWDTVLHLDPWRLPSKYALSEEALQQESNIHYVISTRAKTNLVHANLDQYREF